MAVIFEPESLEILRASARVVLGRRFEQFQDVPSAERYKKLTIVMEIYQDACRNCTGGDNNSYHAPGYKDCEQQGLLPSVWMDK